MAETIFILGAGASVPYGFPNGEKLVDKILHKLFELIVNPFYAGSDKYNSLIWKEKNRERDLLKQFHSTLSRSGHYSIDAFLEQWPQFRELGKVLISSVLLEEEKKCLDGNKLFFPDFPEENWYRYFFNEIKHLNRFKFRIFTFNYDRSLEYFLVEAYRNSFGLADDEIFDKIKSMQITHLHGSLGIVDTSETFRINGFGRVDQIITYYDLKNISDQIEIIYEVNKEKFSELRNSIRSASNIIFIGFGFDKTNMRNMGLKEIPFELQFSNIWATTYKLSDNEVNHRLLSNINVIEYLKNGRAVIDAREVVITANETALSFFKNTLPHEVYTNY